MDEHRGVGARPAGLASVCGGLGAAAAGGVIGLVWMTLFPRPDFRMEETALFAGIFVGLIVGPGLGVYLWFRRAGLPKGGAAGLWTTAAWYGLWALLSSVGPLLSGAREWLYVAELAVAVPWMWASGVLGARTALRWPQRSG